MPPRSLTRCKLQQGLKRKEMSVYAWISPPAGAALLLPPWGLNRRTVAGADGYCSARGCAGASGSLKYQNRMYTLTHARCHDQPEAAGSARSPLSLLGPAHAPLPSLTAARPCRARCCPLKILSSSVLHAVCSTALAPGRPPALSRQVSRGCRASARFLAGCQPASCRPYLPRTLFQWHEMEHAKWNMRLRLSS